MSETLNKAYEVTLVANEIYEECRKQGIPLSNETNKFYLCEFDFLWVQHIVAPLCQLLEDYLYD